MLVPPRNLMSRTTKMSDLDNELLEARKRLPLPALMTQLGFAASAKQKALCPFHDDAKTSFSIHRNQAGDWFWNCFACRVGGDEPAFLAKVQNLSKGDAVKEFKKMAGVWSPLKPAAAAWPPVNWDACVEAFTAAHQEQLGEWRGYSGEFVSWLKKNKFVGLFQEHVGFPVCDRGVGKVLGVHYRLEDGSWRYHPKGLFDGPSALDKRCRLFVIGELGESGHIFESQWDGFGLMDKSGEQSGIVITRGASNGKFIVDLFQPDAVIFVWPQNDAAGERWFRDVCANTKATVKRPEIPGTFKDLNDWCKAGATADELLAAMKAAPTIGTGLIAESTFTPAPVTIKGANGEQESESGEEEPEKPLPKFRIEHVRPLLADIAKATSDSIGTPIEMCAPIALFTFAGCLGKAIRLESVRGHDPTPANLFGIVSKVSGSGGSETAKRIMGPMIAMQQTLRREFNENERPVIEAEIDNVSAQIEHIKSKLRKERDQSVRDEDTRKLTSLKAELHKLKERKSKVLYVTNTTPQALTQLLATHGDTIMHYEPDSGSALAIIAGQGGDKNTTEILPFEVWLKGFSLEPIENWRVGSGNQSVDKPCVSMLFLATPDKVRALFRDSRLVDGGLLSRFLTVNPQAKPRRWDAPDDSNASSVLGTEEPRREVYERWESAVFAVISRYFLHKGTQENGEPEYYEVKMTPEARKVDIEAWNKFCDECDDGKDHLFESRYCELALRVALNLHVSRCIRQKKDDGKWHSEVYAHEERLSKETMEDALAIVRDFFVPHQKEFRKIEQAKAEEKAWKKTEGMFLACRARKLEIGPRDLYTGHKVCSTSDEAKRLLTKWEREGRLLEVIRPSKVKGGEPIKTYQLPNSNRH
jgi:hypothetical protein